MSVKDGLVTMDIDTLYPLVTEAIRQAEALEAISDPAARKAFSEASRLEEDIANLIPLTDYEGVIARRGAVRAAIKAHRFVRALELVARFEAEVGVDGELAGDLAKLRDKAIATAVVDYGQFELSVRSSLRVSFYTTCGLAVYILLLNIAAIVALSLPQSIAPELLRSWITLLVSSFALTLGVCVAAVSFVCATPRQDQSWPKKKRSRNDKSNNENPAVPSRTGDL